MAITQAQPLLLLLVILFFFHAPTLTLSNTKFRKCIPGQNYPFEVKSVKISPDPVERRSNANITITGSTSEYIPEDVIVRFELSKPRQPARSLKTYSICDIAACPVKRGPIVLTFSNVFTEEELKSGEYFVDITIIEDPMEDPMMCVFFPCKIISYYAPLLSQVTE